MVRPPMGPSVRPSVRLTGRPPPTARTGELPRRSPISGGQAAESRRVARGGGHSSSLGSAKSRRGARGGPRRAEQPSSWRRSAASGRRAPLAAAARRPPHACVARPPARRRRGRRAPACPPPRGPPARRRVARVDAAPTSPLAPCRRPLAARWPPAFHGAERRCLPTTGAAPRRAYGGHVARALLRHRASAWREISPGAGAWIACSALTDAASARRSLGLGQLNVGRVARVACSAPADRRSRVSGHAWERAARAAALMVKARSRRKSASPAASPAAAAPTLGRLHGSAPRSTTRRLRGSAAEV